MLSKSSLITNICFAIDNCFAHQKVSFETSSFCELLAFIIANNRELFESENINFLFISYLKTLKPTQHLFVQLFKSLNCTPILEVVISLALTFSKNPEFVRLAEAQLKICLPLLIQSYVELGNCCIFFNTNDFFWIFKEISQKKMILQQKNLIFQHFFFISSKISILS